MDAGQKDERVHDEPLREEGEEQEARLVAGGAMPGSLLVNGIELTQESRLSYEQHAVFTTPALQAANSNATKPHQGAGVEGSGVGSCSSPDGGC